MSAAFSVEIVFRVQYANVSATDLVIYLAFHFRLARLASPPHRSLGMICESGPICMSASCSTDSQLGPPAASITLRMSRSAWLGTAGVAADIEEENVPVKEMLATPGSFIVKVLRVTKSCTTINQHVKYGNKQNM